MATIRARDTGKMIKIPSRRDEKGKIYYACPTCGTEGSEILVIEHMLEKRHDTTPFPQQDGQRILDADDLDLYFRPRT